MAAWLERQTIELNDEQLAILEHASRSPREVYCGDSRDMQVLVTWGLMDRLGRVSWCPDEYFQLTREGAIQMRRNRRERKWAACSPRTSK